MAFLATISVQLTIAQHYWVNISIGVTLGWGKMSPQYFFTYK